MAKRVIPAGCIVLGAVLLIWPAFVNGYPLVFSDTGAFLHQTLGPLMIWDKPWIYGPFMHLFHWRLSLWPVVVAQGMMVSALLWLAVRVVCGRERAGVFLLAAGVVAGLTAAPFSAALLMPDVFTPCVVVAAFLLACARGVTASGRRGRRTARRIGGALPGLQKAARPRAARGMMRRRVARRTTGPARCRVGRRSSSRR
ncbi:hypothetical protein ACE7GA_25710 [Roseomonas sp. CCTCC AB2023176]|uniref:hypothetical protein n=1 Tax=Roseomonas sp. CCTCC AB2023176 TaxID=3342640 RepID=UPI0035DDDB4D